MAYIIRDFVIKVKVVGFGIKVKSWNFIANFIGNFITCLNFFKASFLIKYFERPFKLEIISLKYSTSIAIGLDQKFAWYFKASLKSLPIIVINRKQDLGCFQ